MRRHEPGAADRGLEQPKKTGMRAPELPPAEMARICRQAGRALFPMRPVRTGDARLSIPRNRSANPIKILTLNDVKLNMFGKR